MWSLKPPFTRVRQKIFGKPVPVAREPQAILNRYDGTRAVLTLAAQVAAVVILILLCGWLTVPWLARVAVALLGLSAIAPAFAPKRILRPVSRWSVSLCLACTCVVLVSVLHSRAQFLSLGYVDYYPALIAGLAGAVLALGRPPITGDRFAATGGKALVLVWAGVGALLWLGAAYKENQRLLFYLGLLGAVALLVWCHCWLNPGKLGFQILNSLILLAIGLPMTDLFVQPAYGLRTNSRTRQSYYDYERARKEPTAFARWWNSYLAEWARAEKKIVMADYQHYPSNRLRPNSEAMLFQSRIRINSRGFRGREITEPKGNTYRIVALGESSTFGMTLNADDEPWPTLLERLIQEQIKPVRPVEVINAGIPGYHLEHNLHRMASEILPLKPDMLISYHGLNGFMLFNGFLSLPFGAGEAPVYRERPVRLLGNLEYKLKLARFRNAQATRLKQRAIPAGDPLASGYAREYRQLCQIARTNGIRLVVANFSMAVNSHSPAEAVEFYQASYPGTPWFIPANVMHSRVVEQIAREYPEICFVDTHPELDGVPDNFLDLVHFSHQGDQRFAETMFEAIKPILVKELGKRP